MVSIETKTNLNPQDDEPTSQDVGPACFMSNIELYYQALSLTGAKFLVEQCAQCHASIVVSGDDISQTKVTSGVCQSYSIQSSFK